MVLLVAAQLVYSVVRNPRFEWEVVRQYLFNAHDPARRAGDHRTDRAVDGDRHRAGGRYWRSCGSRPIRSCPSAAWLYIWFFRATPLLVQLLFWGFIGALYPDISLCRSRSDPRSSAEHANTLIPIFAAALLGLSLNEGAYMAEIVRGGILAVDEGQNEAAQSIGMTQLPDDAPGGAAPGDARDHPADWQRGDLDAQEHVAGERARLRRAAVLGADHLLPATTRRFRC